MVTDSIAIIPARGGSKRIPRKNIIDFYGKPMIAWTIEAALNSGCFNKVVVSTDDEEIAHISKQYGADVPFMRETAADDMSPVSIAVLHALRQAESYWETEFGSVVQLMPNCPMRDVTTIREFCEYFAEMKSQFLISCFEFGWMNPWWAAEISADGRPSMLFPDAITKRSQDLPSLYCPTGAIWMANSKAFKQSETFYGPDYRLFPIHWTAAVDIDDRDDLDMAKAIYTMKKL